MFSSVLAIVTVLLMGNNNICKVSVHVLLCNSMGDVIIFTDPGNTIIVANYLTFAW